MKVDDKALNAMRPFDIKSTSMTIGGGFGKVFFFDRGLHE